MPAIITVNPLNPEDELVAKAAAILKEGGVIVYPTETFYGLAVDSGNEQAVEKLYILKGRNSQKPVSLIIGRYAEVDILAENISPAARLLMKKLWPGGVTLILRASQDVSPRLTAGSGKIGLRLSSNKIATLLARKLQRPITATSANISGEKECCTVSEALESLGNRVEGYIDGGRTPGGLGSTIIDVTADPPAIIRQGIVPAEIIHCILSQNAGYPHLPPKQ